MQQLAHRYTVNLSVIIVRQQSVPNLVDVMNSFSIVLVN
jgi:hypothetical protein